MTNELDVSKIFEFKALENNYPFLYTKVAVQTNSSSDETYNASVDFEIAFYPIHQNLKSLSIVFTNKNYENINSALAQQILIFYNDTALNFRIANESVLNKDNTMLQFSETGSFDMYIFAFDTNNDLISYVYHDDIIKLESNPLEEKIALDTIRNGMRIEGLTYGALGLAIMMFLLEIIVKKD
jgi:hypothetical protein